MKVSLAGGSAGAQEGFQGGELGDHVTRLVLPPLRLQPPLLGWALMSHEVLAFSYTLYTPLIVEMDSLYFINFYFSNF